MFQPINGWTKATMLAHIEANFKGKSTNPNNVCVYRGPGGTKCAVGIFIPDAEYDPNMDSPSEDNSIKRILIHYPDLIRHMPLGVTELGLLQGVHDRQLDDNGLDRTDETIKADLLAWVERNVESGV